MSIDAQLLTGRMTLNGQFGVTAVTQNGAEIRGQLQFLPRGRPEMWQAEGMLNAAANARYMFLALEALPEGEQATIGATVYLVLETIPRVTNENAWGYDHVLARQGE